MAGSRDAGREDVALEDRSRDRQARELVHDLREALERGRAPERHDRDPRRRRWRDPLPGGEEPGERDRVDGLDLAPQLRERPAPEQAEDLGIAVLALGATGPELAGEQRARVDQPVERVLDDARRQAPAARRLRPEERPVRPGPAGEQPVERPDDRPEERLRHAGRRTRPDPVAVARDVLHRDPALLATDPRTHGAAGRRELGQVDRRLDPAADGPRAGLVRREVAESPQEVVDLVGVRRVALVGERLEAELEVREGVRVEQLAQLLLAQQLAQEVAVKGQRLGAALGERGVAVVHVRRHVVEQQAPANADAFAVSTLWTAISRRATPPRISRRAGRSNTSARHSRYVSTRIGKLPYRLATDSSSAARWRRCHNGVRVPGRRRGRSSARAAFSRNRLANSDDAADAAHHQVLHLVGIGEQELLDPVERPVALGQADRDPVVGVDRLDLEPQPLLEARLERERPRRWTRPPNGVRITSRQSPSSSRKRSMTIRRSVGSAPVASRSSSR